MTANFTTREAAHSLQADSYRAQIESRQAALKAELASRSFVVAGSVSTLANAVFVVSTPDRLAEMRSLPGVVDVIPMRKLRPTLNKATALMNAPAAWAALGGVSNAGAGIKIGIIDSGIDQTHPAFQDSTLKPPAGFPKCTAGHPEDCNYTNNKIIVARSYIRQQSAPSNPSNPAADSLPDDYSPRDRLGHGTATASVAAANMNTAGAAPFNGMAPKAFLGNYKVLGTGFEGSLTAFEDAVVQAIEDAFNDGMDVVSCSLGVIAIAPASQDFMATAFEKAAGSGLVIAVSAGNDGFEGTQYPTFNLISSPATAPSVIAVGATINSHVFQPSVSVPGAPANLHGISAITTDAYFYGPYGASSAPLVDVQSLGNDGYACTALPASSLLNAFALIQASSTGSSTPCDLNTQATNASNAGAAGIVFYTAANLTIDPYVEDSSGNFPLIGPVVIISLSDGTNLKGYIGAHPGATVVIDPNGTEQSLTDYSNYWGFSPALAANQLAVYSSPGPAPGMSLKPDIVATGGFDPDLESYYLGIANSGMYVATQSYDPYAEIYSPNGYVAADGTSFAAPMVAGAAALVKQAHPNYTAAQIRSALINTASQDTNVDDMGDILNVVAFGAGRLDANAALSAAVTVNPVSVSFGALSGSLPAATPVTITNGGPSSVTLTIAASAPQAIAGTPVTGISVNVDQKSLTVAAGATATLNVSLSGAVPTAGQYSGNITLQGTGVALHIPYLFVVSSNVVFDLFGIFNGGVYYSGACFEGLPNADLGPDQRLMIKLIDANGAPVTNSPVRFAISPRNSVSLSSVTGAPACTSTTSAVTCNTDSNGVAYAEVTTSSTVGATPMVTASSNGLSTVFGVDPNGDPCNSVIAQPNITGISDAAVGNTTVAAGSYISIYGSNLVNPAAVVNTTPGDAAPVLPFPLNLDGVSVSFDVPGSYDGTPADYNGAPGHIVFVGGTGGQINLQVPWELQGASSVQIKVNVDGVANSNVITVPLAQYAPTIFQSSGIVAAVNATTGSIITAANPAHAGDAVELYANGLGPVNNQPNSGDPASSSASTLATTKSQPTVTIGGQNATVSYSGLNPGNPGLYQINVTVPSVASGNQTVTLSIGGASAPTAVIPIK